MGRLQISFLFVIIVVCIAVTLVIKFVPAKPTMSAQPAEMAVPVLVR